MKKGLAGRLCLVLAVLVGLFLWNRISTTQARSARKAVLLEKAYASVTDISDALQNVLDESERRPADDAAQREELMQLSERFHSLHNTFKSYATEFAPPRTIRNVYTGTEDFEFISYTLTENTGDCNGVAFSGILADGVIAEQELQYLARLKQDLDTLRDSMSRSDAPSKVNSALSVAQMDAILEQFFDRWSWDDADNPYRLLCE